MLEHSKFLVNDDFFGKKINIFRDSLSHNFIIYGRHLVRMSQFQKFNGISRLRNLKSAFVSENLSAMKLQSVPSTKVQKNLRRKKFSGSQFCK